MFSARLEVGCDRSDEPAPYDGDGMMAVCEQGYLCTVCGEDVEEITDSVLYLRYVLGEVDWDDLNRAPEKHIRCEAVLAQFIVSDLFPPVKVDGVFSKASLDPEFVRAEEVRVTSGLLRLRKVVAANLPIFEYPLSQARARPNDDSSENEA